MVKKIKHVIMTSEGCYDFKFEFSDFVEFELFGVSPDYIKVGEGLDESYTATKGAFFIIKKAANKHSKWLTKDTHDLEKPFTYILHMPDLMSIHVVYEDGTEKHIGLPYDDPTGHGAWSLLQRGVIDIYGNLVVEIRGSTNDKSLFDDPEYITHMVNEEFPSPEGNHAAIDFIPNVEERWAKHPSETWLRNKEFFKRAFEVSNGTFLNERKENEVIIT